MFGIPDFFSSFILFLYVLISHFSRNFRQILKKVVPLYPISLLFLEFQSICFGMVLLCALFTYFLLEFQIIFLLKFGSSMPYFRISFWNSRKTLEQFFHSWGGGEGRGNSQIPMITEAMAIQLKADWCLRCLFVCLFFHPDHGLVLGFFKKE